MLFIDMIDAPWADKFPWRHYAEAAMPLPANHATIARDIIPAKKSLPGAVRQQYPDYMDGLISQIRAMHYQLLFNARSCHAR